MHPKRGISRIVFGRSWPKAATTKISAFSLRSRSTAASSLTFSGWKTGMPYCSAQSFTSDGAGFPLRPLGRSGCVTTRDTSCFADSASAFNAGTAKSGVPIKTIFIVSHLLLQALPSAPHCQPVRPAPDPHKAFRQGDRTHGTCTGQEAPFPQFQTAANYDPVQPP